MANKCIRKDFVDGVQEIFTTLFNNGSETYDGLFYYPLSDKTITNVYGETKDKLYKEPLLLVCKAEPYPTHGEESVEEIEDIATFTVTLKSLLKYGLNVDNKGIDIMRRGMVKFKDTYYRIDNIKPRAYVEDVFLLYEFRCVEEKDITELLVESKYLDELNQEDIVTNLDLYTNKPKLVGDY